MLINELPDDCLLIIFGYINELDDLLNCYKVSNKWSHLIAERARKVKYLVDDTYSETFRNYAVDYVNWRTHEPIDGTCLSTLFPNLKIAEFSRKSRKKVEHEDIVALVKKNKSLKGLICELYDEEDDTIIKCCDELEMLYYEGISPSTKKNGVNIKQLNLGGYYTLDKFKRDAHHFPNLERLSIINGGSSDSYYDGPIFRRLKIVELALSSYNGVYYGFQFMDSCPNLQSAHIFLDFNHIFVDESLKHESLQDLVLNCSDPYHLDCIDWNELKRLFMKYPNLKHLSLWSNRSLENEHVEQLVRLLPKLVLFDVRGCPRVTQTAANHVQDYCKLYGRSIKFYFDENEHEIQSDWPHLSTKNEKISHGFDFMKHCFLKDFYSLSIFLVPSEG